MTVRGLAAAAIVAVAAAGCAQPDPEPPVGTTQTTAQQAAPPPTTLSNGVTPPSTLVLVAPSDARSKWEACYEAALAAVADPWTTCGPSPDAPPDPTRPADTGGQGCYGDAVGALLGGAPIGPDDPRIACDH